MKTKILLGSRVSVAPERIVKLVAQENYTLIHFLDGSELLSSTNIGKLEDRLQSHSFFRMNRSIVINLDYLNRFAVYSDKAKSEGDINNNSNTILLSRRRKSAFEALISNNISM